MGDSSENPEPLSLVQAVLDTFPEPLVVLNGEYRIVAASRAFRTKYANAGTHPIGASLFDLFEQRWDVSALRELLLAVAQSSVSVPHDALDIEPELGKGATRFSARRIEPSNHEDAAIVLTIADISKKRARERDQQATLDHAEELLRQQSVMLRELEHRVANSLQIIASILMIKARSVASEETRAHLEDAHSRVISVAEVQRHLHPAGGFDKIEVCAYLTKLCAGLSQSIIRDRDNMSVKVICDEIAIPSRDAVSLGLIVTELVINAIKHAFPESGRDGVVMVTYERTAEDWKLVISDNGVGVADGKPANAGLGSSIVAALADSLEASVETHKSAKGFTVAVTRATYSSRMPRAN